MKSLKPLMLAPALTLGALTLGAVTLGTAAIAQQSDVNSQNAATSSQNTGQPSGQTVDDPSQSTGPQGITQQGTDPNGQARAPVGTNMGVQGTGTGPAVPMANQGAAFAPRPAAGEYPVCSRTVTDSCIQAYERGVSRSRRRGR